MITLYVGGYAQGKLEYAREHSNCALFVIDCGNADGNLFEASVPEGKVPVLYHYHLYLQNRMHQQENIKEESLCEELETFFQLHPDCIVISDEVGNGIVPMEARQRNYRELLGRVLIRLAKRADCVERVICGMGQKLK